MKRRRRHGTEDYQEQCLFCFSTADEHEETYTQSQDSGDEQKRCVRTADEHAQDSEVEPKRYVGTADEHERAWGQESEVDHERCLVCLSTAEVSKLRDMSKQLQDQSPTTTTNAQQRWLSG